MKSYEDRVYEVVATVCESLAKTRPQEPLGHIRKVMTDGPALRKHNWRRGEANRAAEYMIQLRPTIESMTAQLLHERPSNMKKFIIDFVDHRLQLARTANDWDL